MGAGPVVAVVARVGFGIGVSGPLVHQDRGRVGNDGSRTLGVSAVCEVAELPAQVVVEVGGDGLRLRVSGWLGRPLAVVTVSVVAEAVGVSVVAVPLQVTIPIAVARVPVSVVVVAGLGAGLRLGNRAGGESESYSDEVFHVGLPTSLHQVPVSVVVVA